MKVPFHLRRTPGAAPAVAFLLPAVEPAAVLTLCARLGSDPLPAVHAVADGFLLRLRQPTTETFPGVIRLRALAENLLLPVGADLAPTLRDDEAGALARDRGLVFLPGGRILAFDPKKPLPLSALLGVEQLVRRDWQPLPSPRPRAERLLNVTLALPPQLPEDFLDAGGQDIGTEDPRPDDAGMAGRALGQVQAGAGRGLMWLGQALGLGGLARLGARMLQDAVARVPRLTESLLGKQEAALRALLKEFREGDLEKALRRALPLGHEADRGPVTPTGSTRLPFNNLLYSLSNLLGSGGGGRAGVWLAGFDVQQELMREYRRAAEEAARQGDFRRAAFIYAKLLRDYRLAANALAQGGLHHDAALIYLRKLNDKLAAAQAFESAGEIDRAVDLYRQCGRHVQAGDLLLRVGEDEAALAEYRVAADQLVRTRQDHLGAGELMASKAGRLDLARTYWEAGWAARPSDSPVACGLRLARLHADTGEHARLRSLLAEADAFLEPPGNENGAGQFYNEVALLADRADLAALRDDLRDYALVGLATKLRQRAATGNRSGDAVGALFGRSGVWPAPVVSDAQHAWKAGLRPAAPPTPAAITSVQVGRGTVTAAGFATGTGEIVLGFEDGALACFRPTTGEIVYPPFDPSVPRGHAVVGVAVATGGRIVASLRRGSGSLHAVSYYQRRADGQYERGSAMFWHRDEPTWLAPTVLPGERDGVFAVGVGNELRIIRGRVPVATLALGDRFPHEDFTRGLLLPVASSAQSELVHFLLFTSGRAVCRVVVRLGQSCHLEPRRCWKSRLQWGPWTHEGTSLAEAPLAWWEAEPHRVELAGLSENGTVYWSALQTEPPMEVVATNVAVRADRYLAATIVRPGFVAAVAPSSIDWLRAGSRDFRPHASTKVFLPTAVACFPSHVTHELIVVCKDGVLVRVPVPA
jgi:tetratricopeptide (TPR) repeat protein